MLCKPKSRVCSSWRMKGDERLLGDERHSFYLLCGSQLTLRRLHVRLEDVHEEKGRDDEMVRYSEIFLGH